MTPRPRIYTLEYKEEPEGWKFILTTYSGRSISEHHPDFESCNKSAKELTKWIKSEYKLNHVNHDQRGKEDH